MTDAGQAELIDLIAKVALKDRAAFQVLYERSSAKLYGVLIRLLKDSELAEEALQDVFVKVWQKAESFRQDKATVMTWMITIARYRAIDMLRVNVIDQVDDEAAISAAELDERWEPYELTRMALEGEALTKCLDELDAERRSCLLLAYCDGYSHAELSARFQSPLGTVKSWIRRSLNTLKLCLTGGSNDR